MLILEGISSPMGASPVRSTSHLHSQPVGVSNPVRSGPRSGGGSRRYAGAPKAHIGPA